MDQNKICITPNGKKLKQAQLWFKKTECDSNSAENHNKRKLDIQFDDNEMQLIKISRLEDNLNANDNDINEKSEHNLDESKNEKLVSISILLTPYATHNNEHEEKCNESIAAVDEIHDVNKTDLINKSLNSSFEQANGSCEVSDIDTDGKSSEITSPSSDASKTPNNQNKDGKIKKLTAKQISRREKLENRKKEILKLKQEKDKIRAENREKRLSLKMERDELQRKKREEKEKKRLAELELKNEEKRLKEEEKRLKDEERKAKEEEKKAKEEEKRAKEEERKAKEDREKRAREKLSSSFTKFFVPKNKPTDSLIAVDKQVEKDFATPRFMPFEVKENMYIAPIYRRRLDDDNKKTLENSINLFADLENLYLNELKSNNIVPRSTGNTWNFKESERFFDEGVSAELKQEGDGLNIPPFNNIASKRYRAKLLQFEENRRPAYWGTWRKRSSVISGRCPFRHDKDLIDYDIDSDEEWEDEEPGESLHDSDEEKEPMDDYEVDNDLFVPHGYLSDEECAEDQQMSPTAQKMKLDLLNEQFNAELMEQTKRLQIRYFGCIWISNNKEPEEGTDAIENLLLSFRAVYNKNEVPFKVPDALQSSVITSAGNTPVNAAKGNIKAQFPDLYLADLISILHGHQRKAKIIAKEFNEFLTNKGLLSLPFSCITRKIKEISVWKNQNWCVHDDIRNKYPTEQTKPVGDETNEAISATQQCVQTAGPTPPSKSLITKFTKILTPEEKQKQLESLANEKSVPIESKTDSVTKPKNANNNCADVLKHHTKQASLSSHTSNSTNLITKFTKVLTPEEKAKRLESSNNKRSVDKETASENFEGINAENVANAMLPPTTEACTQPIEGTNKSENDNCSLSPCRSTASQCSTNVTNSNATPDQSGTPKRRRITPIFISKIENIKSLSN